MNDKNERELRELVIGELKNVIKVRDRIANDTKNWSPNRLFK